MSDVDVTKLLGPGASQSPKGGPGGPAAIRTSKGSGPLIWCGLLLMSLWFILWMVDIAASEAIYTHAKVTSFTPEWDLLLQIPRIITGMGPAMPIREAQGSIVAWVLAACTLVCMVGFDHARDAVKHANHRLDRWFATGLVFFACIDFVSNAMYGPGDGTVWYDPRQLLFAAGVTFAGFFFGVPGYRMLEHGIKTWWSSH